MKLIDWVAYEPEKTGHSRDENLIVWRWPSESLTLGTQLIVNQSQEAIFYKGGQALDLFGPGTHTLAADNLPLIQKIVNLPFGGRTPFTAEIFFVNKHAKLDLKWGTPDPFRVTDPLYKIILPVRSFGQFGIRVADTRSFITQIVGTLRDWNAEKINEYFQGLVVTKTKDRIAKYVAENKVCVMDITAKLNEISDSVKLGISDEFARFGIEIVNFFIMSINVPNDDPSIMKIQEVMAARAEIDQLGEAYRVKRTFDTLEKAAANENGTAGALLSGGVGVGMGIGVGASVGTSLGSILETTKQPATSNAGSAPNHEERLNVLKTLHEKGLISAEEYRQKKEKVLADL